MDIMKSRTRKITNRAGNILGPGTNIAGVIVGPGPNNQSSKGHPGTRGSGRLLNQQGTSKEQTQQRVIPGAGSGRLSNQQGTSKEQTQQRVIPGPGSGRLSNQQGTSQEQTQQRVIPGPGSGRLSNQQGTSQEQTQQRVIPGPGSGSSSNQQGPSLDKEPIQQRIILGPGSGILPIQGGILGPGINPADGYPRTRIRNITNPGVYSKKEPATLHGQKDKYARRGQKKRERRLQKHNEYLRIVMNVADAAVEAHLSMDSFYQLQICHRDLIKPDDIERQKTFCTKRDLLHHQDKDMIKSVDYHYKEKHNPCKWESIQEKKKCLRFYEEGDRKKGSMNVADAAVEAHLSMDSFYQDMIKSVDYHYKEKHNPCKWESIQEKKNALDSMKMNVADGAVEAHQSMERFASYKSATGTLSSQMTSSGRKRFDMIKSVDYHHKEKHNPCKWESIQEKKNALDSMKMNVADAAVEAHLSMDSFYQLQICHRDLIKPDDIERQKTFCTKRDLRGQKKRERRLQKHNEYLRYKSATGTLSSQMTSSGRKRFVQKEICKKGDRKKGSMNVADAAVEAHLSMDSFYQDMIKSVDYHYKEKHNPCKWEKGDRKKGSMNVADAAVEAHLSMDSFYQLQICHRDLIKPDDIERQKTFCTKKRFVRDMIKSVDYHYKEKHNPCKWESIQEKKNALDSMKMNVADAAVEAHLSMDSFYQLQICHRDLIKPDDIERQKTFCTKKRFVRDMIKSVDYHYKEKHNPCKWESIQEKKNALDSMKMNVADAAVEAHLSMDSFYQDMIKSVDYHYKEKHNPCKWESIQEKKNALDSMKMNVADAAVEAHLSMDSFYQDMIKSVDYHYKEKHNLCKWESIQEKKKCLRFYEDQKKTFLETTTGRGVKRFWKENPEVLQINYKGQQKKLQQNNQPDWVEKSEGGVKGKILKDTKENYLKTTSQNGLKRIIKDQKKTFLETTTGRGVKRFWKENPEVLQILKDTKENYLKTTSQNGLKRVRDELKIIKDQKKTFLETTTGRGVKRFWKENPEVLQIIKDNKENFNRTTSQIGLKRVREELKILKDTKENYLKTTSQNGLKRIIKDQKKTFLETTTGRGVKRFWKENPEVLQILKDTKENYLKTTSQNGLKRVRDELKIIKDQKKTFLETTTGRGVKRFWKENPEVLQIIKDNKENFNRTTSQIGLKRVREELKILKDTKENYLKTTSQNGLKRVRDELKLKNMYTVYMIDIIKDQKKTFLETTTGRGVKRFWKENPEVLQIIKDNKENFNRTTSQIGLKRVREELKILKDTKENYLKTTSQNGLKRVRDELKLKPKENFLGDNNWPWGEEVWKENPEVLQIIKDNKENFNRTTSQIGLKRVREEPKENFLGDNNWPWGEEVWKENPEVLQILKDTKENFGKNTNKNGWKRVREELKIINDNRQTFVSSTTKNAIKRIREELQDLQKQKDFLERQHQMLDRKTWRKEQGLKKRQRSC
ncbi:hypothetical protein MAR_027197 [Mya arenaria]|uniref:Uncharacterized protein n=1 Tax=Mya arenaria TaxID=6604 RepID=A0ABY7EVT1_MYAAR|nr:hypothetical protein MAR_027197 [Mya arenaria]